MARRSPAKAAPSAARKHGASRKRRAQGSEDGDDVAGTQGRTKDIWKGSIAFGLVEIPVALVAAELSHGIKLTYLDRRDFSPVGYKRSNKATEEEVAWQDIVRGYEYEKGEYVVLTPQDLERASPELTKTIDILHFVEAGEIEPIYYERPYYLEPLKPRSKGYVLLRETLKRTKKVGIARVAIRAREHIAAVGVRGNALVLYLLRFSNEVRAASELDNAPGTLEDARVQPRELEIAQRLVEDMSGEWEPKKYTDEYAADLMKLIQARVASGRTHVVDESEPKVAARKKAEVSDLMPLLKRSLEAARGTNGRHSGGGRNGRSRSRPRVRKPTRARRGT
jgi:DNA end-binding protein Ku